ncbi:amino acid adenylation domain-containing protein [Streptomyces phaeolivaceus]|uniref:Amino acid adenylation domain-containing protein n=1 Tax=Streptomyces phaeolivaceus TaxID=2653200 RepID=A0A5P8K8N1_9ACTN|nr:non-ribosomal peptide synthetase [Streptomyces phaeolivaceus]QFQ99404.1 amino acid adenylation domain-containing protein [Streptomyces phaeolivaceus]
MNTDEPKQVPGTGARLLRERLRQRAAQPPSREQAISPIPRDRSLPLSFAQQRLWVLDQLRPGGTDYLVPLTLRLRGDLSTVDLPGAVGELVRRHEILRTRYVTNPDGEPVQVVDAACEVAVAFTDLVGADPGELDSLLEKETTHPLDLAAGPVLRVRLIRLAPEEHMLVILVHHIAVDGWSGSVMLRELTALCTGRELPAPALQYADFATWQRDHFSGERLAGDLAHWTQRLRDLPTLELPLDRPRPATWQPAGTTVRFDIPAAVGTQVALLAKRHQATPFMVYLAALWTLLHRYTGQTDFPVATPIAGRTRPETHDLLGIFVNLLVLRADVSGDPTFAELLERARSTSLDAYTHQDTPFERIVDALGVDRDLSKHPLAGVNLTLQNNERMRFEAGAVIGEPIGLAAHQAKFDLSWTLEEHPDGSVSGEATFPHALLDTETVRRMTARYVRLLGGAVADPGRRVGELPLLDREELAQLARPPAVSAPADVCLHERFAAVARERPDTVAVTWAGEHLTYAELDTRTSRLAHRLRARGVGRGDLVGICLPRSADMVVALLAVLRAGAAYLPLDPDQPAERIDFLVRDASARVVITRSAFSGRVAGAGEADRLLVLDAPGEAAALAALPAEAPKIDAHPDDLAYAIYTSGSTGTPKGVQVTHANVVRLFTATDRDFRFGPDDVWALFHSYAFDFSVWEMWGALLYGGRLVVVPYEVSRSPWDLSRLLADEGVTVLNQTPSAFRSLTELAARGDSVLDGLRLRLVVFGGEALDVAALAPWWDRFGGTRPQLVNMYGITETTVHVTYRPVGPADLAGDRSPIGQPIPDLATYVLDERMAPVPVGVPGELHVGGAGVTRGYLGRPRLTAERFVPDPFGPPGARLYRSGDKARVLADGELAFVGRADEQVKIRGFRIELGEVRACLSGHPRLASALVTVHETAEGERHLVAYAVPAEGAAVGVPELRAYVAERLPGYMVPAFFVLLEQLPLTVSGKTDHGALPAPEGTAQGDTEAYVAPRTDEERAVAAIWAGVLGTERIGLHDNFFAVGGDSIRAVRLVGALLEGGHRYSVQDLFRHQTVAELLRRGPAGPAEAEEAGIAPFALVGAEDRAKVPDGVVDAYPMARVQAGMAYELLADTSRNLYHNVTSYLIRDTGAFDVSALAAAADALVAAHEILRTSFDLASFSEPMQLVHAEVTVPFGHEDLRGEPAERQAALLARFRDEERARVLDISRAPLIRLHAHHVADNRWYLSLTENHAILDGWSHNSIVTELLDRYRAIRDGLPQPDIGSGPVRYADFIAQEQRSLAGTADRAFWRDRLGSADRLAIPAAWADPDGPETYAVEVPFHDIEDGLRRLAERAGASLKSVLLAAHISVWRIVGGDKPFYSGVVANGRTEVSGGDLVRGMFLNPVPFRAPAQAATWRELVAAVFAEEVELWPHRRYPLPEIQREFAGRGRLLEVAFNYLDFHVLDREMVDTSASTDVSPNEFPLCALTHRGRMTITAKSAWVGRRHAELLARMYRAALEAMAADPEGDTTASLLPAADRERLLAEGNDTWAPKPDRHVQQSVAAHAERTPQAVAVESANGRLTYGELLQRANAWAALLRGAGVRAEDLVGLCLPREPDAVAAMLGVLTVGAAYVPVDPEHPIDRITGLLEDAGVAVVIADPGLAARLPAGTTPVVVPQQVRDEPGEQEVADTRDESLVYVVHTSGSTGRPKGVMARHGAFADRVRTMGTNTALTDRDVVMLVLPLTTDVAQMAVFSALANGGRLVLADGDLARDPQSLGELLEDRGATFLQASPTTWRMLTESEWTPPPGFRVLCGGEAMDAGLTRLLCATEAQVWDMYGPTEATVFCFGTRLAADGSPQSWAPAANTRIHLLDDRLEPVPAGVPGQIFVAGDGLARGYLGQPGRTAEVFLPDPHSPFPGGRIYATGDIGRRDRHGRVEVLGREDLQVKIRGFRIELGEIEKTLSAHPEVRAAVVRAVPGPHHEKQLAAYVIPLGERTDVAALRQHVGRVLPAYMVPTHFVVTESFPLLANGKVDRSALPAPDPALPAVRTASTTPQGPVEQAIARVWGAELGRERVGRDDDFFGLGGHSLLTTRIVARLRREHGLDVTVREFLRHRTVRELAAVTEGASGPASAASLWLSGTGTREPLFCVHPGGGSAHWYRDLADVLAPERPLGAFEWPGLSGDHEAAGSVAQAATTYLAQLRAERPRGPYTILGWCASSGIAWEMARRLHTEGERPRLVLLDPVVDATAHDTEHLTGRLEFFRRAERQLGALRERPEAREIREELLASVGRVVDNGEARLKEFDLDGEWPDRLRSWRELLEARLAYRFPRYPGRVELVMTDDLVAGDHEAIEGMRLDGYVDWWRGLADGGLGTHRVAGGHWSVLRPPYVEELAARLAVIIDNTEE